VRNGWTLFLNYFVLLFHHPSGSAPKMTKEQRERKRTINRLSAQRKRARERNLLDSLTDQFSKLAYINSNLEADNKRLEKLKQKLSAIIPAMHQPMDASSQVMMKIDTVERLRSSLSEAMEEAMPSHATAYDPSTGMPDVKASENPFSRTTEYLKEKLNVLETSKQLILRSALNPPQQQQQQQQQPVMAAPPQQPTMTQLSNVMPGLALRTNGAFATFAPQQQQPPPQQQQVGTTTTDLESFIKLLTSVQQQQQQQAASQQQQQQPQQSSTAAPSDAPQETAAAAAAPVDGNAAATTTAAPQQQQQQIPQAMTVPQFFMQQQLQQQHSQQQQQQQPPPMFDSNQLLPLLAAQLQGQGTTTTTLPQQQGFAVAAAPKPPTAAPPQQQQQQQAPQQQQQYHQVEALQQILQSLKRANN